MTTGFSRESELPPNTGSAYSDESIGRLIGEVAGDVSKLFRQEVALAKAEMKEEAVKAGKAGGMLAGAGFAGYMVAVLLSLAAVFGLGAVMPLGWAAVIVAVVWAIVGAVLYATGRQRVKQVDPVPRQTIETLKEDGQWLRDQTK
jgi:hypothetical protein